MDIEKIEEVIQEYLTNHLSVKISVNKIPYESRHEVICSLSLKGAVISEWSDTLPDRD